MQEIKSTCCYCGVGCGVIITENEGRITGVRGDPDHPANFGRLCTKGSTLQLTASPEGRALFPELRKERSEQRVRTDWDQALEQAADRFAGIIEKHGPDSVAFYVSGQLLTEDYYVFNKLSKGLIGTNNIDTNSRLCMSSAVAGYKATLGMDAPPTCYTDIAWAHCIFITGSNMAYAHPILFRHIEDARREHPDLKLIVVDPRRTDTAAMADLHLAILPGTDVALYNGMLHVMLWENLCDLEYIERHTQDFESLKQTVREYTPEVVAHTCGITPEEVIVAARWFGESRATLSFYCQGLNQSSHGTDKNAALINLHLATGQIGKPGAGPFSLTGQPNAMGGREVGGMANLLSGHRDLKNPEHRAEVARLWSVPSIPEKPGKTAVEMFEAVASGEIKAIWIACTNPAQSMPDASIVRTALEKAEFVVLQEAYRDTDTAPYADLLLPASSWGEKEGTVTNSERRISHVQAAVAPPGEARADWEIAADFAKRLGKRLGKDGEWLFPYAHVEQVFMEHRETTRGRDLDITGLSYGLLDEHGPQQWPFPAGSLFGTARLYLDGVFPTASGRAMFANTRYLPVAEQTDARYPIRLNTGRLRDQWHAMSRTGNVARLFSHAEEPLLTMNPEDLSRRGIKDGDIVSVKSRRGKLTIRVQASQDIRIGQAFLPMHWGSRFMSGPGINVLTVSATDPASFQPELKHAAIQVEKYTGTWQMVAMGRGDVFRYREQMEPLLHRFDYATLVLYGRDEPVLVFTAAHGNLPDPELLKEVDRLMALDEDEHAMTYSDPKRGISKRVILRDGQIMSVRLTGETAARDWLKQMMADGVIADTLRHWVLAPLASPPAGTVTRGKIICNCLNVSENEILGEISRGADLADLKESLKCGTQCGSCVPEIRRILGVCQTREAA